MKALFPTITPEQAAEYLRAARIRCAGKIAGWRNAHQDWCEREAKLSAMGIAGSDDEAGHPAMGEPGAGLANQSSAAQAALVRGR